MDFSRRGKPERSLSMGRLRMMHGFIARLHRYRNSMVTMVAYQTVNQSADVDPKMAEMFSLQQYLCERVMSLSH